MYCFSDIVFVGYKEEKDLVTNKLYFSNLYRCRCCGMFMCDFDKTCHSCNHFSEVKQPTSIKQIEKFDIFERKWYSINIYRFYEQGEDKCLL
jgi:hypothetical protein